MQNPINSLEERLNYLCILSIKMRWKNDVHLEMIKEFVAEKM